MAVEPIIRTRPCVLRTALNPKVTQLGVERNPFDARRGSSMMFLMGISAALTTIVLVAVVVSGAVQRRTDLLSFRNIFLLGFCFFYGLATIFIAFLDQSGFIYQPQGSGYLPLAIMTPGFAALFMLADGWGQKWSGIQKLVPKVAVPPTTPSLMIGIVLCLLVAVAGLTTGGDYFSATVSQVRPALASCAAGLATYFLVSKKYNPVAWGVFLFVFALSLLLCVTGSIDRRYSLSVFIVVAWVWYYTDLRYKSLAFTLGKMAIIGAVIAFFIVIYSGIRGGAAEDRTIEKRIEQFREASQNPTSVKKGALDSVLYQDAPINTLYIIENYPDIQPLDPFNGLLFFATNPIPRFLWEDKPIGLGSALRDQFGIAANLGPGIIGHGWSEGMWIGVAGYALVFGLLCGVLDRATRENATNPFFLSVFGGSMGNFVGLARGETSLFMVLLVSGAVACLIVLGLMNLVGNSTFRALPMVAPEAVRRLMQRSQEEQGYGGELGDDYGTLPDDDDSLQDPEVAAAYGHDQTTT